MIPVGIHENLRHHKVTKNDKGTLILGFKREATIDPTAFNDVGTNTAGGEAEQDFMLFPPSNLNKDGEVDSAANNSAKVKELKDQLNHILLCYMPKDKIVWDVTAGTGMTGDNAESKLKSQETLNKMYTNICDQYTKMITPFLSDSKLKMRMIFVRASRTKHFPSLRRRYLDSQPFIEPMTIPSATTRIKFTDWELKNGYSNPDKVVVATEPENAQASTEADIAFATTADEVTQ